MTMFYKFKIIFFILTFSLIGSAGFAADIYVDQTLSQNITDGKYSIANRNNSGSDGNAYTTAQAAINAMNPGDHIYLRNGTYQEGHIQISPEKNPTDGNWSDNYNLLASYKGEWAVLDGENNITISYTTAANRSSVIGQVAGQSEQGLSYWKFERIEIKNGRRSDGAAASGFWGNNGPFWFKYCYIHDNYVTNSIGYYNNGGLKGCTWHDSIVEYCWFERNGALNTTNHNEAHINIYSDYSEKYITPDGFDPDDLTIRDGNHNMRNEYRYNYFDCSDGVPVAIKHKNDQYLTRHDGNWQDEYNNYGDKIHHNIIVGATSSNGGAILIMQDFTQAYNNILDNCTNGLTAGDNQDGNFYKVCFWNNLIYQSSERSVWRKQEKDFDHFTGEYYGYDYNNLIYQAQDGWNWCDITIDASGFDEGVLGYTNYIGKDNYFYDGQADISRFEDTTYNQSEYESNFSGNDVYVNAYDSENLLFKGSTGADKYKILSTHIIEEGKNSGNAGAKIPHPYLSGIAIPDYIGPADSDKDSGSNWDSVYPDPDDGGWIDYVISLQNISILQYSDLGTGTSSPLSPPQNLMIE